VGREEKTHHDDDRGYRRYRKKEGTRREGFKGRYGSAQEAAVNPERKKHWGERGRREREEDREFAQL